MVESRTASSQRSSVEASWPGERYPSHRDVEIANESLEPGFLNTFRDALLASSAAQDNEDLMHVQLQNAHLSHGLTYPVSILYQFPELPAQEHIDFLVASFSNSFARDVLVNSLPIPSRSQQAMVPYFKLSVACLACAALSDRTVSLSRGDLARNLFFAGNRLWNVMLEVDNTEARTIEGALSPMLLSMYGALSSDVDVWNLVEHQLLASSTTMARRLRLQEIGGTVEMTTVLLAGGVAQSSVITFFLLVSVLSALHMDIPMYLTPNELGIRLGPVPIHFQQAYTSLLNEDNLLGRDWPSHVEPSTLLLAILSDSISVRRSLGEFVDSTSGGLQRSNAFSSDEGLTQIPHVPLTAPSEYERILHQLSCALDRWLQQFGSGQGTKHLALYFFCRLYLSCHHISSLPRLAKYPPAFQTSPAQEAIRSVDDIAVSDETIKFAWSTLDNIHLELGVDGAACPTWYPVIIFYAGLAVWARTQQRGASRDNTSSPMQLIAFKIQLDRMSWPCCQEMASTFDRLTGYR